MTNSSPADRQYARQFAVLLQDPEVAQGAPQARPGYPDSPHCRLVEPGNVLRGLLKAVFAFVSAASRLLTSLSIRSASL